VQKESLGGGQTVGMINTESVPITIGKEEKLSDNLQALKKHMLSRAQCHLRKVIRNIDNTLVEPISF
jgi:hypothetical protein